MIGGTELRLARVDVAVSAEHHNPSILTPDFLLLSGVVPSHWRVEEAELSREFSSVLFHNGVLWVMNQERLLIEESRDGLTFSEPFEVHQLARRYLEEVRMVPYLNLVLSFHGWAPIAGSGEDPRRWLAERLLQPGKLNAHPGGVMLEPTVLFDVSGALVRLTMTRPARVGVAGEGDSIGVRVRVLYRGDGEEIDIRDSRRPLLSALSRWPNDQPMVLAVVRSMLAEETIC